jgi:hypothetical protein
MHENLLPNQGMIYFEIGNEENIDQNYINAGYPTKWETDFASAAQAINNPQNGLVSIKGYPNYRILTGGMAIPSATGGPCNSGNDWNIFDAATAIGDARADNVPDIHLGVAVHPYSYLTNDLANYWKNFQAVQHVQYLACNDLGNMLATWWIPTFFNLPVFITEDNWNANDICFNNCSTQEQQPSGDDQAAYLADLLTWMHHFSYDSLTTSQVRLTWFTGVNYTYLDSNLQQWEMDLGLYNGSGTYGGAKTIDPLSSCSRDTGLVHPQPPGGHLFLHNVYVQMKRLGWCY